MKRYTFKKYYICKYKWESCQNYISYLVAMGQEKRQLLI